MGRKSREELALEAAMADQLEMEQEDVVENEKPIVPQTFRKPVLDFLRAVVVTQREDLDHAMRHDLDKMETEIDAMKIFITWHGRICKCLQKTLRNATISK